MSGGNGASRRKTLGLAGQPAMLKEQVDGLREAIRVVKLRHPFEIVAMVVLPDHLHAVWRLPPGDMDYPKRWALIKAGFSRGIANDERIRPGCTGTREH